MDTALVMSAFFLKCIISFARCKSLVLTKVLVCKYEWMALVCFCLCISLFSFILCRGGSFHDLQYISLDIAFLE